MDLEEAKRRHATSVRISAMMDAVADGTMTKEEGMAIIDEEAAHKFNMDDDRQRAFFKALRVLLEMVAS